MRTDAVVVVFKDNECGIVSIKFVACILISLRESTKRSSEGESSSGWSTTFRAIVGKAGMDVGQQPGLPVA